MIINQLPSSEITPYQIELTILKYMFIIIKLLISYTQFKFILDNQSNIFISSYKNQLKIYFSAGFIENILSIIYSSQSKVIKNISIFKNEPDMIIIYSIIIESIINFGSLFKLYDVTRKNDKISIQFQSKYDSYSSKLLYMTYLFLYIVTILIIFENILKLYNPVPSKEISIPFNSNVIMYIIYSYLLGFIKYIPISIFIITNNFLISYSLFGFLAFKVVLSAIVFSYNFLVFMSIKHMLFIVSEGISFGRDFLFNLILVVVYYKSIVKIRSEEKDISFREDNFSSNSNSSLSDNIISISETHMSILDNDSFKFNNKSKSIFKSSLYQPDLACSNKSSILYKLNCQNKFNKNYIEISD